MYTKLKFAVDLKNKVSQKQDIIELGIWVHSVYIENCEELEPGLRRIMLDLSMLELGPDFAFSYAMLNKIADDLIAGKKVDLNSDEYREVDEH